MNTNKTNTSKLALINFNGNFIKLDLSDVGYMILAKESFKHPREVQRKALAYSYLTTHHDHNIILCYNDEESLQYTVFTDLDSGDLTIIDYVERESYGYKYDELQKKD